MMLLQHLASLRHRRREEKKDFCTGGRSGMCLRRAPHHLAPYWAKHARGFRDAAAAIRAPPTQCAGAAHVPVGSSSTHFRCSRDVGSAPGMAASVEGARPRKLSSAHCPAPTIEHMLLLRADVECEASLRCVGVDGERAPVHVISAGTRSPDSNAHRASADLRLALIHPSAVRPRHLNSAESAFRILRKRQRYFVRCCADCRANWGLAWSRKA